MGGVHPSGVGRVLLRLLLRVLLQWLTLPLRRLLRLAPPPRNDHAAQLCVSRIVGPVRTALIERELELGAGLLVDWGRARVAREEGRAEAQQRRTEAHRELVGGGRRKQRRVCG